MEEMKRIEGKNDTESGKFRCNVVSNPSSLEIFIFLFFLFLLFEKVKVGQIGLVLRSSRSFTCLNYWILCTLRRTVKSNIVRAESDRFWDKSYEVIIGEGRENRKCLKSGS